MDIKRAQVVLVLVYAIFLVSLTVYVKHVLSSSSVKLVAKNNEKTTELEVKPVNVVFKIEDKSEYKLRMQNTNTTKDMLDYLRNHGDLSYETTEYTYGTEIDSINHQTIPSYKWRLLNNEVDITNTINQTKLKDNEVYILKLVKL
jgi:hypothetical protein